MSSGNAAHRPIATGLRRFLFCDQFRLHDFSASAAALFIFTNQTSTISSKVSASAQHLWPLSTLAEAFAGFLLLRLNDFFYQPVVHSHPLSFFWGLLFDQSPPEVRVPRFSSSPFGATTLAVASRHR